MYCYRSRFLSLITLVVSVLVILIAMPTKADVRVHMAGGHEDILSFSDHEIEYISLSGLTDILGGDVNWERVGHQVVLDDPSYRFEFLINSPFVRLHDSVYNLTYPVQLQKGQLFVPAQTFLPLLDRVNVRKITWNDDNHTIRIETEYFNVTDLMTAQKANGLLIEIYLTTALAYEVFVTEGDWVNVSIRDGMINRARILTRRDSRFMYQLKVHQVGNTGQISFRLKRSADKLRHKLVDNPPRIQISVPDSDFELTPVETSKVLGSDDKIDVIAIDPGHGGDDYGAIGPRGTREKDIVLQIARELAKMIRDDKEFKVVMTRDRDRTVSLEERARTANKAGADLFISIHANASPKRSIRGWNVFFLAPARNDSARAVEQLENSFFLRQQTMAYAEGEGDDIDPVLSILNEMIMTEFQAESHDFAMIVEREFRRHLKTRARGVDQAGFFVLNKVFTPSVLIETAFISNKTEEQTLRSKSYQRSVAKALYNSIKRFKARYESN
jgi:N-acetylmuramoyl-L-alanine amidase